MKLTREKTDGQTLYEPGAVVSCVCRVDSPVVFASGVASWELSAKSSALLCRQLH